MAAEAEKPKTWVDMQKTSVQVAPDPYLGLGGEPADGGAKAPPNKKKKVDQEVRTKDSLIY
jgi:hypothetical protein